MLRRIVVLCLLAAPLFGDTGVAVPSLAPFEQLVQSLMSRYGVPGASIALTKNGRLVFARGYGYADRDAREPVQPDSRFRIASMSKFITAIAVMRLVEDEKLNVDQPAFALLPDLRAHGTEDPRLAAITVRHLLNHTAGWNSETTFDPLFSATMIAGALDVPSPASAENIIRYMRGRPLQSDPGTHYVYSNFGYLVLGRIIERVSGLSYEQYVRTRVLAPMGITGMRIGQTLPAGRLPGEVKYYSAGSTGSVLPYVSGAVDWAYGGWQTETTDSAGGWVTSAIDYARFINAIDGRRGERFLSAETVAAMSARPSVPEWDGLSFWYGFGMRVHPAGGDADWDHGGSIEGATAQFFRMNDGGVWVVLMNSRPGSYNEQYSLGRDLSIGLVNAGSQVTNWPQHDLFSGYPDTTLGNCPGLTTRDGVLNSATFDRGIVAGSWITLTGANLAGTTRDWTAADIVDGALPETLDGVDVRVNGMPAFVSYVSPTQINAQAPEGLVPGWVQVEVTRDGCSSGTVPALVLPNAPGLFTYRLGGSLLAVATLADGTLLGERAAAPGQSIVLYATGIEPSPAGGVIGAPRPVSGVEVSIGGVDATVSYAGVVMPGLFQINVVMPDVPDGRHPVVVRAGEGRSQTGVAIPVSRP